MKQLLMEYAAYNVWANQRITDIILKLPEETVKRTVKSSFSSLYLTLLHVWTAESTWWQRLKQLENMEPPGNTESSIQQITTILLSQSAQWKQWVEKSTSAAIEQEFIYRNSKKEQFKQPVYQMLLHVFNHSTYHRGQLVSILRQSGVTTIYPTDFIVFTRVK